MQIALAPGLVLKLFTDEAMSNQVGLEFSRPSAVESPRNVSLSVPSEVVVVAVSVRDPDVYEPNAPTPAFSWSANITCHGYWPDAAATVC